MISVLVESVLLALFSLPLMFTYSIIPGNITPYWLFGIIFFTEAAFIAYAYVAESLHNAALPKIINFVTPAILVLVFGGIMWTAIANRGSNAPGQNMGTHDIVLQLEAALRYVGSGKNPYKETYFGTPMESWHYSDDARDINPALYHFVMPPWYLEFSYPFYFVSMRTLGYFDGRMPLLFSVTGICIILLFFIRNKILARISMILVVLAPLSTQYIIEGRSDMFVLFWLLFSLILLEKKKLFLSSVVFALAVLSKQTVWFMLPLFTFFLYIKSDYKIRPMVKYILSGGIIIGICTIPFLVWDYRAFFDSVVFYLSGNTVHGYPVAGYGLGMILKEAGVIKNIHDYYPFWIWQLAAGIPALIISAKYLRKHPSISALIFTHGITLFIFWYTSRYFNNSHMLYVTSLLLLSAVKKIDEQKISYVQKQP